MSGKQSNRQRTAQICHQATGVDYARCLQWAREGRISRHQPVPDAESPAQRRFEALLAHTLTELFRDCQLDGAVLGLQGVDPEGDRPALRLHPVMADRMVEELLPRFDVSYGGIRGVAGLRLQGTDGQWLLADLCSSAAVRLMHDDPDWQPRLPRVERGLTAIWRDAPARLSSVEGKELAEWEDGRRGGPRLAARDLLFSRILRRPLVINEAGRSHGWANTYTHHTEDIVFEWCCGAPAVEVAKKLHDSGVTAKLDGVDVGPSPDREPHDERIDIGEASVVLRCLNAQWCQEPRGLAAAQRIAAAIRRRYA
ncbi:hypothetical protein [Streptomyces sp. WP-1]|uniref:hypothetical protein n=1 Tax=Streptomyces sp. WP-1 TaxID=3041497 RepID=UPI0026488BBF|nr:hypothetical protein [Streptomyces sp. WP-1]WKE69538.1 hypothetical protein QHG49_11055 [Streptomyces sp. WP-1]